MHALAQCSTGTYATLNLNYYNGPNNIPSLYRSNVVTTVSDYLAAILM